jgi:cold shock CspA family protein
VDETKELAERVDQNDKFRKGRIVKYFPQAGYGFVRDDMGHEVYFHLDEVRFVGKRNDRRYVSEGAPVVFDVGRTSRGLRVTRLKLY